MKSVLLFRHFLFFIFGLALIFGGALYYFNPAYYTSDDVVINSIVSGVYGSPDEHVVFPSCFLGFFLKSLYVHFPGVSWMGYVYYFVYFMDWLVIGFILNHRLENKKLAFIFFLLLFLIIGVFLLNVMQFTMVAGFTSICGLLLFCSVARTSTPKEFVWLTVASLFYCTLGFLFRSDSCFLTIVLFIPFFIFDLVSKPGRGFLLKRQVMFLGTLGIICSALLLGNQWVYQKDEAWKNDATYLRQLTHFIDFITPFSKTASEKAGWTLNDYVLLREGFFVDSAIFSSQKMSVYLDHAPSNISRKSDIAKATINSWMNTRNPEQEQQKLAVDYSGYEENSPTAGTYLTMESGTSRFFINYISATLVQCQRLLLLILALGLLASKEHIKKLITAGLWTGLLFVFLILVLKPPPIRVVYIIVYAYILAEILCIDKLFLEKLDKKELILSGSLSEKIRFGCFVPILFFLFFSGFRGISTYHREGLIRIRDSKVTKQVYTEIRKQYPESIFFAFRPKHGILQMMLPFDSEAPAFMKKTDLIPISGIMHFPLITNHLKRMNIFNPATDIFMRKDILIFSSDFMLELYKTFVKEHYKEDIRFVKIDQKLGLYKIETNPATDE